MKYLALFSSVDLKINKIKVLSAAPLLGSSAGSKHFLPVATNLLHYVFGINNNVLP